MAENRQSSPIAQKHSWAPSCVNVKGNQLTIQLKCKLTKDVNDADFEYGFGCICAAPFLGRPYSAITEKGKAVEGTIPVRATSSDSWSSQLTPDPFTKMQIDSRIGKMTIDVTGNPGSLIMMDYRMNAYEAADRTPDLLVRQRLPPRIRQGLRA